jgi:S1-C subfamily serine protease
MNFCQRSNRGTAHILTGSAVLAILIVLAGVGFAQDRNQAPTLVIAEFGAVIFDTDDGPRIADVTPAGGRLEQYQSVNLQSGDLIVAANGQRIKTLSALKEMLNSVKPGDEVRLGVQRTGGLAVALYVVGTEEECRAASERAAKAPDTKVTKRAGCAATQGNVKIREGEETAEGKGGCTVVRRIVQAEPGEGQMISAADAIADGGEVSMFRIDASGDAVPWVDLSVMLEEVDGEALVSQRIEMPMSFVSGVELLVGDHIASINGNPVNSAMELVVAYDELNSGDNVALAVLRDGESLMFSFDKPQNTSTQIMKKR